MIRPTLVFVCLAAALMGGCTGEDDPLTPDAGRACAEDDRRCAGDVLEICDDGDWSPIALCDDGCAAGACLDPECTPACAGRQCGDDGCGGTCGACADGVPCLDGACVAPPGCGDGACDPSDEDCSTCPADCGACCGDGACADDEDCATCPADCRCPEGELCDLDSAACVTGCEPIDCADVECGGDGCGGRCGDCGEGLSCVEGACVAPPPRCGDAVCDDGESCRDCPADCGFCCGDGACVEAHDESCATCPADCGCPIGERCDAVDQRCGAACTPDCAGRLCGDDGCDGACGACADGAVCDADGRCVDAPPTCGDGACEGGEDCATCPADCGACCGDGVCRGGESCATCPADCGCADDELCDVEARRCAPAECEQQCQGRSCGPDGCGGECGRCDGGLLCDPERGRCVQPCVPVCDGRVCGDDGCGDTCGDCPLGWACVDGACDAPCVPDCAGRLCGDDGCGGTCGGCGDDARCAGGLCLAAAFACDCPAEQRCISGSCHFPDEACAARLDGLCDDGGECAVGLCQPPPATCDAASPDGICPVGALCEGGACAPLDPDPLCDDDNPCTVDTYDVVADACVHLPRGGICDDGDACTTDDVCSEGLCGGAPVVGCAPIFEIDPYPAYTNAPRIELTGRRGVGVAVVVDGDVAVPMGADPWRLSLDLEPGENVFRLRGRDGDGDGGSRRVRVVYETEPPTLRLSPGGQSFVDGVTVTVAASEPATVYYTTDGSVPDTTSARFEAVHTFRVFDDTTLSLRARDRAGNWQPAARVEQYRFTGADNGWTPAPPLRVARVGAAAALDGDVVWVVGGDDGVAVRAAVERFDDGRWTDAAALPSPRAYAAAAIVGGGLAVFGGLDAAGRPLTRVERLVDGQWRIGAPMSVARAEAAAITVGARVHVLGGRDAAGALTAHAIYDPAADAWSPARPLPRPRLGFGAAVGPAGRIYLVGGADDAGRPLSIVDVYDPATDTWSVGPALPTPRLGPAVALDDNGGRVGGGGASLLVAGGVIDGAPSARVDEYLFTEQRWVRRRPLPAPRAHAAVVTPTLEDTPDDRRVVWVIAGRVDGAPAATTARYHRVRDAVRARGPLGQPRVDAAAAALDERIYVLGGALGGVATTTAELYDPETGHSARVAPLPEPRADAAAVAHADRAWLFGGHDPDGTPRRSAYAYDPAADTWRAHPELPIAVTDAVAAAVGEQLYVIGGADVVGATDAVQIFEPATGRWRPGPPLPAPRRGAVAVGWQGRIYVAGGRDDAETIHPDLITLDPTTGAWSVLAPTGFAVYDASAARLAARLVVLGGVGADGALSDRRRAYPLDGATPVALALNPSSRLVEPHARAATVAHNGELYTFGGEGDDGARAAVYSYAGRCLDGTFGPGEGAPPYEALPDLGAGCGDTDITAPLGAQRAFGHHGQCDQWNACGNAEGCADLACAWFGYGDAQSWRSGFCTVGTPLDCDLFRDAGATLDTSFVPLAGCQPRVVYEVVCRVQ